MPDCLIRTDCRLCRGHITPILNFEPTPLANGYSRDPSKPDPLYPLYLSRCDACGHVQLPVEVRPALLFSQYEYASGASKTMVAHLDGLAEVISERLGRPSTVVEIGSNDGTLLAALKRRGHEVVGIEPAANLAAEANARGLTTYCEFWGDRTWHETKHRGGVEFRSPVDCVVACNVYAHVADICGFTRGVAEALKPGGWFVFEVGYLPDQLGQGVWDIVYHEHLDYWTLRAALPFLERHGLYAVDAERIPTQDGSIRVWCQKADEWNPTERLLELAEAEPDEHSQFEWMRHGRTPLDDAATLTREIWDRVGYQQSGQLLPLIAYGAAAKLTTLRYQMRGVFEPVSLDVVVDDNPLKQGLFTPGEHVPIVSQERLDSMVVPGGRATILLTAHNMTEEVLARMKQSPSRMLREARVLCPFPEVRWL